MLTKAPTGPETLIEPYFKAIAANATHDYWKHRRAGCRDDRQTDSFEDKHVLETFASSSAASLDRAILLDRIDRCLEPGSPPRTIFWLYYRQGLTAKEIASIPEFGLTVKGIESLLLRLKKMIKEKLE